MAKGTIIQPKLKTEAPAHAGKPIVGQRVAPPALTPARCLGARSSELGLRHTNRISWIDEAGIGSLHPSGGHGLRDTRLAVVEVDPEAAKLKVAHDDDVAFGELVTAGAGRPLRSAPRTPRCASLAPI